MHKSCQKIIEKLKNKKKSIQTKYFIREYE